MHKHWDAELCPGFTLPLSSLLPLPPSGQVGAELLFFCCPDQFFPQLCAPPPPFSSSPALFAFISTTAASTLPVTFLWCHYRNTSGWYGAGLSRCWLYCAKRRLLAPRQEMYTPVYCEATLHTVPVLTVQWVAGLCFVAGATIDIYLFIYLTNSAHLFSPFPLKFRISSQVISFAHNRSDDTAWKIFLVPSLNNALFTDP